MEKRKVIVRIIVCFLAVMSFICLLTSEAEAKRQKQGSALSQYLDRQIESSNVDQLIEVAKCKAATEKHLIQVAKICAGRGEYWDIKIAKLLEKNPRCTGKVMEELAKSENPHIRLIVAKSKKSKEKALMSVAIKLVQQYANNWRMDDYMWNTTDAIIKNPKRTSRVLSEIAKCCVSHGEADYALDFAKRLAKDSKSNGKVMRELVKSDWFAMQFVVAKSNKSDEEALRLSAKYCANFPYYERSLQLAKYLKANSKTTCKVMMELSNSKFKKVASIGHHWIEKRLKKAKRKKSPCGLFFRFAFFNLF